MAIFGSVLTAMVTPFDENGELDLDRAQKLAKYLVDNGNDGLVVAGTTGESPTITVDEQVRLIRAVREAVPHAKVLAGAGSNSTAAALSNIKAIKGIDVDGLLLVAPYYNKPSQAGLLAHFNTLIDACDKPVMVYDVPHRTGRRISVDTMVELAQSDKVVALKDATGDLPTSADLIARTEGILEVYSGDDSLTMPFMSIGAVGVVSVTAHWVGKEMSEMISAYQKGDVMLAAEINAKLIPSYNYSSTDDAPNPVPSKTMMNLLGVPVGKCRLPMGPEPEGLVGRANFVLDTLGRSVN